MSNYTRKPRMARYEKKGLRRSLLTVLAAMLLVVVSVGGTIAWLQDTSEQVVNTFSPSNIAVDLDETTGYDYQIVPGINLDKDPDVSASSDVDYYVFIKIDETNWPTWTDDAGNKLVTYAVDSSVWTELEDGVYYIAKEANEALVDQAILVNEEIVVSSKLTDEQLDTLYNENGTVNTAACPKLTFTAYAIQQQPFESVADAWAAASAQ